MGCWSRDHTRRLTIPASLADATPRRLLLAVVALALVGFTSVPPLGPIPRRHAGFAALTGSWFDSTNYRPMAFALFIQQRGDSVFVTDSALSFVRSSWHGVVWWSRERGGRVPDVSVGTVTGDSLTLCDSIAIRANSCPNQFGYLRDSGVHLVLYSLWPHAPPRPDTVGGGATFVRGVFAPPDTTPAADAPPPVKLNGTWVSDWVGWSGTGCSGAVQFALLIDTASDQAKTWTRECGDTDWRSLFSDKVLPTPYPCTPANSCTLNLWSLAYRKSPRGWDLVVSSADTLIVRRAWFIDGWTPSRFVRAPDALRLAPSVSRLPKPSWPAPPPMSDALRWRLCEPPNDSASIAERGCVLRDQSLSPQLGPSHPRATPNN